MGSTGNATGRSFHGTNASGNAKVQNGDQYITYASTQREISFISNWTQEKRNQKLLEAAAAGQILRLERLIDAHADLDYTDSYGFTALHEAVRNEFRDCVELLFRRGADINARDIAGGTPLYYASNLTDCTIAKFLVEKRANARIEGKYGSPLHVAAMIGSVAILDILLNMEGNRKLDIEAPNADGETALLVAVSKQHEEAVKVLLDSRADIEAENGDGLTSLNIAARHGNEAVVGMLLSGGANIEGKSQGGSTALMHAAQQGQEGVVRLLLGHGASIEEKGYEGYTALIFAAQQGHKGIVKLLLDRGSNPEGTCDAGSTALMYAAQQGREEVVKLLLHRGARIDAIGYKGYSALIFAAEQGHEGVVRLLLERGASTHVKDKSGEEAIQIAERKGNSSIVNLLGGYSNAI